MRTIFLSVLVITALAGLSSCTRSKNIPEWVLKPPVNKEVSYGIGFAKPADAKDPSKLAEKKAIISAIYMNRHILTELLAGIMLSDGLSMKVTEETETIELSWKASEIEILKLEQTPDGTWWCLAVYNSSITIPHFEANFGKE